MKTESSPLFLIGQNSRGKWIAQKQSGRCGGLFVSHEAALKFALMENGNRREAVITVPGVFELDMNERSFTVVHCAATPGFAESYPGASLTVDQPVLPQAA